MALSEFTRKLVEIKLGNYCREKAPDEIADEVRLGFKIWGNKVTLFEEQPDFFDPDEWITIPVAQFRYDDQKNTWSLYCADRYNRWHRFEDVESVTDFDVLLDVLEEDSTGIFWGKSSPSIINGILVYLI
jgi:hypothetical protein